MCAFAIDNGKLHFFFNTFEQHQKKAGDFQVAAYYSLRAYGWPRYISKKEPFS